MKRYWLSWYESGPDTRPLTHPPNDAILGWWYTGVANDGSDIICALVQAMSENDAWVLVRKDWPNMGNERFSEERSADYVIRSDRFPLSDWMIARMGA